MLLFLRVPRRQVLVAVSTRREPAAAAYEFLSSALRALRSQLRARREREKGVWWHKALCEVVSDDPRILLADGRKPRSGRELTSEDKTRKIRRNRKKESPNDSNAIMLVRRKKKRKSQRFDIEKEAKEETLQKLSRDTKAPVINKERTKKGKEERNKKSKGNLCVCY